jgi:hypothetical protein
LRHNETDGEICAVADPDDDDDNSAANHIEKVGAQRCGEHDPENPQSSRCKLNLKKLDFVNFLREKLSSHRYFVKRVHLYRFRCYTIASRLIQLSLLHSFLSCCPVAVGGVERTPYWKHGRHPARGLGLLQTGPSSRTQSKSSNNQATSFYSFLILRLSCLKI